MSILVQLFSYRYFIFSSIKTEFKARFIRSKLGALWAILNPLAQVLIYTIILSSVLSAKIPGINMQNAYAIYLISGIICWSLFADILGKSINIFVENANLIKKIPFPKIALLIIHTGVSVINNFILLFIAAIIFVFISDVHIFGLAWLLLPFTLTVALAFSLGLILGIINVFIRDVGQIMSIFLQLWFWVTPIVYTVNIIPDSFRFIVDLNPLTALLNSYRSIILYGQIPTFDTFAYPLILTVALSIIAYRIYTKAIDEMADLL